MKKLIALLAVACVSFTSCSETFDAEDPNGIMKKFDFSEVDTDNLKGIQENSNFSTSDLTVLTGTMNDCCWIGVFDTESGSLQCQYTDEDHPTSYFAYGEEYKYEVGEVLDAYFERNKLIIVIKYADSQYDNSGRAVLSSRKDLISVTGDSHCRYVLDEKSSYSSVSITKWTDSSIYIILEGAGFSDKGIIYDVDKNEILSCAIGTSGIIENDIYHNLMISPTNVLHFWDLFFCIYGSSIALRIEECQCTYNTISSTEEFVKIYDCIPDYSSQSPRYSHEYKTRTGDHISAVFTQTEYDGTVTKKIVDIRVENDELKVDIQE